MGLAGKSATFMRRMRRSLPSFLTLVLAVSTLSAISVVSAPNARALVNSDCTPTVSGLTATAVASGNDCIITFTAGTGTWTASAGVTSYKVLVVGGGGGGGADAGGAGGGGGIFEGTVDLSTQTNRSFSITVGAGGLRVWHTAYDARYPTDSANNGGTNGGLSKIEITDSSSNLLAIQSNGGNKGTFGAPAACCAAGGTGGSVSLTDNSSYLSYSTITNATGGTGGTGFNFASAGNGGNGSGGYSSSTNFTGTFGGGGGGGADIGTGTFTGGSGVNGGGVGGSGTDSVATRFSTAGTTNTGGGGGAGSAHAPTGAITIGGVTDHSRNGAPGGSGVVMVRFTVPTLATPSTPDLDAASDTGQSSSDNYTNDSTPTFSGTATAGSTIQLYADGVATGSACTTNSSGNWTCTAGTLSHKSAAYSFTVTSTLGFGTTTTSAALSASVWVGNTAGPSITWSNGSGTLSNGQTAQISFATGRPIYSFAIEDITVTGGTVSSFVEVNSRSFTAVFTPTANSSGTATITVDANKILDLAGNNNNASTALSIPYNTFSACSPATTTSGGFTYVAFKSVGTCSWSVPAGIASVDYLVVGGGGGGGTRHAGGGGAGGLLQGNSSVSSVTALTVTVGAGGAGGDTAVSGQNFAYGSPGSSTSLAKTSGSGSFTTITAQGGGEGKTGGGVAGGNGGSGGGSLGSGGTGTAGQGNNGGTGYTNGSTYWIGGGGGGAGGGGGNASTSQVIAGNGGAGTSWTNSGFSTAIASALTLANTADANFAGGGGGGGTSGTAGTGGTGGGGDGNAGVNTDAGNGVANTGGGGGGGGLGSAVPKGGSGGSGVVLLRYLNAPSISLSTTTISAPIGSAVTSYSISNSGGAAASYSISPSFSVSGLSFSTSTGLVSGTATTVTSSTTYTITATNSSGTSTATFSISAAYTNCSPTSRSSGGFTFLTFSSVGACSWSVPSGVTSVDVLVAGGGGGGAGSFSGNSLSGGGGGGGGGVYIANGLTVSGTSLVTVGAGGSGGAAATSSGGNGSRGGQSSFDSISAGGGGGGGCDAGPGGAIAALCTSGTIYGGNGTAAGSGGGASNYFNAYNYGGAGTASNSGSFVARSGFIGGRYLSGTGPAGAGGGAGGDGSQSAVGSGRTDSTFTATSTVYGQGGGAFGVTGWSYRSSTSGYGTGGDGGYNTVVNVGVAGAAGAQGVVIVRYANSLSITYDTQGGSSVASGSTNTGGAISSSPGNPTRAGFTFTGWFVASTGGTAITFPYTHNQTGDFTLFAQWLPNYQITVTQTSNGTISPSTTTVTSGTNTTFTFSPAAGYQVDSILIDGVSISTIASPNLVTLQDAIINGYTFTNVTGNRTISATYAPIAATNLLLNLDGFRSGSLPGSAGTSAPTWTSISPGATVSATGSSTTQVSNGTTTSPNAPKSVYFNNNGSSVTLGSGSSFNFGSSTGVSLGATSGVSTPVTVEMWINPKSLRQTSTLTPWNILFTKWFGTTSRTGTDSDKEFHYSLKYDGTGVRQNLWTSSCSDKFGTFNFASNLNKWFLVGFTVDGNGVLQFYLNGKADGSPFSGCGITVRNSSIAFLGDLNQGAGFDGSIGKVRLYNTVLSASTMQTNYNADAELFAQSPVYTVTYDYASATSGNSTVSSDYIFGGTAITLPSPSRTGYAFDGWYEASDLSGTKLSSTYSTTQSRTIYAKWIANSLVITYNSQGGSAVSNGSTTTGGSISASPGSPTRTGYSFNGWFSASSGGSALTFPYTHNQTGNFSLFAQWTPSPVSITTPTSGLIGRTGSSYSLTISTSGGSGTGTFAVASGTLPSGITLNTATGVISGTPTGSGTSALTITFTDSNTLTATTSSFSIVINSNDATLSALTLSSGTLSPTFSSGTTSYTASVANATTNITITPTRNRANATITVNGTDVTSGSASGSISLNVGSNTVTIVVTAPDGVTTATYTVNVTRAASNDANLSGLTISSGSISPTFSSSTVTYTATVLFSASTITFTPTINTVGATIQIKVGTGAYSSVTSGSASGSLSLNVGSNTVTILVTAQDGTTTKTYTVTVTRSAASGDADLTGLTFSAGTLLQTFSSSTTSYNLSLPNSASSITVTPVSSSSVATISVNGSNTVSGTASSSLSIIVGLITRTIVVTAENGTTKTYTITIARAPPTWLVAAAGTASAIFTATTSNGTTLNNGNYFYFGGGSMGFAPNSTISQGSADTSDTSCNSTTARQRLSWHLSGDSLNGGWRAGCQLGNVNRFQRAIYQSNSIPSYFPSGPQTDVTTSTIESGGWTLCWVGRNSETASISVIRNVCTGTYLMLAGGYMVNVTYDRNDGSGTTSTVSVPFDSAVTLTANSFTRVGSTFAGWTQNADGTGTAYTNSQANVFFTTNTTLYAKWASNITVTFDRNDSSGTTSSQIMGASLSTPLTPNSFTRSGFTFTGWNLNSNGTGTAYTNSQSVSFANNTTLYAQWSSNVTVTFNSNVGAGATSTQSISQNVSTSLTPNSFTNPGSYFISWTTNADGTGTSYSDGQSVTLASNLPLYAKWGAITYTVTFDATTNGGSAISPLTATFTTGSTALTLPTPASRVGFSELGWFTSSTGGTKLGDAGASYTPVSASNSATSAVTYYFRWLALTSRTISINAGSYTSTYSMTSTPPTLGSTPSAGLSEGTKSYASSTSSICTVNSSTGLVAFVSAGTCSLTASISAGSTFAAATSSSISFTISLATQTVTWSPTLSISATASPATPSALASALGSPTITYAVQSAGTTGCTVNSSTAVLTFTAPGSCTVRATAGATSTYAAGTADAIFTISAAALNTPSTPTVVATAGTLKSIAVSWTAVTNTTSYTLKLYATDGTTLLATITGLSGTTRTITASDYSSIADNTAYQVSITAIGSGNYTSSSESSKASVTTASGYTLTYSYGGATSGNADATASFITGASALTLPVPAKTGYAFDGWYEASDLSGTKLSSTYTPTQSRTIYAKWIANTLVVTFDSQGGTSVTAGSVLTGANLTAPTPPSKAGYTFSGWSTTTTGSTVSFTGGYAHGQTASFTLYAIWSADALTITYNSKGGSSVADGSFVTGGNIASAPTAPTRAGYTLSGWSLTDGGAVITYPYTPTATSGITLYAIWSGVSCSPTSTTTGGYTIYTFTTAGTCFWTVPNGLTDVEILAVAGGGGGGYSWDNTGAGGGAGGQVKTGTATLSTTLEVTVGGGGTAGTTSARTGGTGGNTVVGSITALGGTGGCAARSSCSTAAQATSIAAATGGAGGIGGASGRGGGGSNTAGSAPTTTTGGVGVASSYSGSSVTYGVGGAGGTARAGTTNIVGTSGSANTGNGGAGASAKSSSGDVNGGAGGSGLVVIRVASALTITYDSQSGSSVSSGSTATGASIATAPTDPTRSNYTFLGWFTATSGGSAISFPYAHGQTADFTLYARWALNTYAIAFNANNGSGTMANQTVTHGTAANLNANLFTRANYVFHRWATAADGTGTTYNNLAQVTLTAGTTLYAQWTANTYVVTYNYNNATGGNSTATSSFTTAGTAIVLPTPTRTGFTFAGWFSDSSLTSAIGLAGANYSPTGTTLSLNAYAKWTAINYTFTYDGNSADSGTVPTETAKQITQTATVSANTGSLVRAGYTFSGWNTQSNGGGTNYLSGSIFTVQSSNVTLYAKWSANTYTVTYNSNGGTGNAQRSSSNISTDDFTTGGASISLPAVGTLQKSGYTFGGWNTSAAGTGTNYSAADNYTTVSNVILYAKWNPVTYSITYNGNTSDGGSAPTTGGYTTGQASPYSVLSNTFTKTSNVFGGWNTAANGTGTSYSPGASITTLADIVLYATWIPQYTLHYAINGGSVSSGSLPADQLYNSGSSVGPVFSSVSRTGYTFGGWVNGAITVAANGNFTILADSVLTAKWNPINYTISYNSDGGTEAPSSFTKQIGQSYTVGAPVSKPGYNFTGWSNGSSVIGAGATVVTGSSDVTYTAQWVAKVYTISYDWNGGRGTAVSDVNYTFGTTAITLPLVGDRVKDGYTFAGWSESSNGSALGTTYIPSQSRTLYALWNIGNFTVTYDAGRGTVANSSVAVQNGGSTVLPLPTRANFVFNGWHTAVTGGTRVGANGDSFTPSASQTVYARWIQSSLYGITDSLSRIGSVVTSSNIANTFSGANSNSSVAVSIPANALPAGTTINFDLVGNSSRATGILTGVNYLVSIALSWLTGDETVPDTAADKPISVTISNSSIKAGAAAYAIVNNVSTLLGTATQDGVITVSITSDPEIVVAATKPTAPRNVAATSNGNQQSVISWSAPTSDGGSAITGYTVTSNTGATCTTSTTSCTISSLTNGTGYTFTVTATNNVGTSVASTAASATTASLYTVTFDAKGGTTVTSGSFLTASTVSEPTAPTRTGYSFAGWAATDGGAAEVFPYAPGVTTNITMYARWDALDHVVTFDSKSGSAVADGVFASGGTVTQPTAPTRTGYTFAGWSATDGGAVVTFPYAPGVVTDITLYAKWSVVSQNSSSGSGGGSSAPAPAEPSTPGTTVKSNVTVVPPVTVVGDQETKGIAVQISTPSTGSEVKPPAIKIDAVSEKFIADVKVVDGKLVLTPETGFSGKKTVTVTVTENGADRIIQIPLTVLPEPVTKPVLTPTASNKTIIRWTESPNADAYSVYLNGKKICSTEATSCSVNRVLGPDSDIQIISNGGDRTISTKAEADFKQVTPVQITRLVSATVTKATLSRVDTRALDKVIALIKSQGFGTVVISEITTTSKTKALADARLAAIKKYIDAKTGSEKITFEVVPPTTRTFFNNIAVKG